MSAPRAVLVAFVFAAACRGPDRGEGYVRAFAAAERLESTGRFAEASAQYDLAASGARVARDREHVRYLAARLLARSGDVSGAAARLRAIADASPPQEDSAAAANAVAEIEIARGDHVGWADLERFALRFPSSGVARHMLRRVAMHEDETAGPRATLDHFERLAPLLERTELGETVAYEVALHLATLGEDARARDAFIALAARWPYPHGAFWDDALFRASVLDEKLGRDADAIADLERMLGERETSSFMGSYERPRYEPAMVRLCALVRERLHDSARARACFDRIYRELTSSELRDDALWEESRLAREDGDAPLACAVLVTLVNEFPGSRYVPCALTECPGIARPTTDARSRAAATCHRYIAGFRLGAEKTADER